MSTDPDQIRDDIERTRAELSSDVDALTDKVSPTQAAQRQAERCARRPRTSRTASWAPSPTVPTGSARRPRRSVTRRPTCRTRPRRGRVGTRWRPASIAFGVGWLVSSLLPSTRQEQRLAQSAKDQAAPLLEEAKDAAQERRGQPA